MRPSAFEDLRAANAEADASPVIRAEDRLITKAREIFDLVQTRDRHFQHPVMADHAMDVMLSLFLAEFSGLSSADARTAQSIGGDDQHVVDALLDAGLIERVTLNGEEGALGLTPLGAGRIRSFISAYPDVR